MPADEVERAVRQGQARGAMEALKVIGEDLIGSAIPLTPVEEGTLRASYDLAFIVNGARYEGEGAYGQAYAAAIAAAFRGELEAVDVEVSVNEVYAARQHEELDWQHPLGGQAKYLEQPLREKAPRYPAIVRASMARRTPG